MSVFYAAEFISDTAVFQDTDQRTARYQLRGSVPDLHKSFFPVFQTFSHKSAKLQDAVLDGRILDPVMEFSGVAFQIKILFLSGH